MAKNIIAFIGKRYSGKSLASEIVCSVDSRFSRKSFADVLRQEFSELNGVPIELLTSIDSKEEYRPGVIKYSYTRKAEDPAYFAKKLFENLADNCYVVIDDLRFLEELKICVENQAAIYLIYADNPRRRSRGWVFNPEIDEERSETDLDLSAYILKELTNGRGGWIFNNSGKLEFRDEVEHLVRYLFPQCLGISSSTTIPEESENPPDASFPLSSPLS